MVDSINKKYIKKMAAEHFSAAVFSIDKLGKGGAATAYKVVLENGKIVVFKNYHIEGMYQKEASALRLLRRHSPICVPEVYFVYGKTDDILCECICMEYIKGVNSLIFKHLLKSKSKKKNLVQTVVEATIKIHNHTSEKFGCVCNPIFDTWQDYYKPFCKSVLTAAQTANASGKLKKFILDLLEKSYSHFDFIFSDKIEKASLLHGDLNVMNIMVDKKTLEPVAFIDPLNSVYGDPEYDIFQFKNLWGDCWGFYDYYKDIAVASEKCDLKTAFYAFFNEVNWVANGGKLLGIIMNPIVKNIKRQFEIWGLM